jgi:hypothetical protein
MVIIRLDTMSAFLDQNQTIKIPNHVVITLDSVMIPNYFPHVHELVLISVPLVT